MTEAIIVAAISLAGTALGTWGGIRTANKLTLYRVEQLEKKMDKHNNLIERMALAEHDIKDIQQEVQELKGV